MFKLIKNGDVYAPEYLGKADVLICNDKILEVAPNIEFDYGDVEVIDATGKMVVPGLIDQHVHITGGGGEGGFTTKVTEIGLSDLVRGGVTTVVGVLGTDSVSRNVESVLAKVKALNEEGLTAYCYTGSYDYPSPTFSGSISRDISFVQEVIGVKMRISDHRYAGVTKQELTKMAAAARVAGLVGKKPGVLHMHMGRGKDGLKTIFEIVEETDIPVKTFRPTHATNNIPDMLKLAQMGGYADFTTCGGGAPAAKAIREFMEMGAPEGSVTMSSDSNGSMPVWNELNEVIGVQAADIGTLYDTVRCLHLNEGLSLTDALKPVTVNVAEALGMYPQKGALQAGSDADVLILNSDCRIEQVYAHGKRMMENCKPIVKGYFEK